MGLTLRSVEPNGRPVSRIHRGKGAGVVHAGSYIHLCHFRRVTVPPNPLLVVSSSLKVSRLDVVQSCDCWCNRSVDAGGGDSVASRIIMLEY